MAQDMTYDSQSHDGCAGYAVPFPVPDMPYGEAVRRAHDTGVVLDPSLDGVRAMLRELGNPERRFRRIQVVGTNGKTSTARIAAAILRGEGRSTGLYVSPQLVRFNERIEIGGAPVPDRAFAHGIAAAVEAGRRVNARLPESRRLAFSPFEYLTVAAVALFAEARVDAAVMEAGMGARWDATSAVDPQVVAITGIGLDHTRILGGTLAEIAREKSHAIQPGRAVVLGEETREPSVREVIDARLREAGVEAVEPVTEGIDPAAPAGALRFTCRTPRGAYRVTARQPSYQGQNISCAIALAEALLDRPLDGARLQASLGEVRIPGRFEFLRADPPLLVDACHNPQSCANFARSIERAFPDRASRPTLLLAVLRDKDVPGIARELVPRFPRVCVTQTSSARALPAEQLAEVVRAELGVQPAGVYGSVAQALDALSSEPLAAAGTITLAGEVEALRAPR